MCARKTMQAGSVYRSRQRERGGEKRREEEGERSVCVAAREHVRRACVRVRRTYVCARLRHVGSLFVPRAERPAVSAVSFYSRPFAPRPSGVTSPLTVLPPLASPPRSSTHRSPACV